VDSPVSLVLAVEFQLGLVVCDATSTNDDPGHGELPVP
jgi:hypothetical protein